jgi:preprotein translocase subunit SecD
MLYFSPAKMITIIAIVLASILFSMPNFFAKSTVGSWPSWVPNKQLQLVLDLRGGAHLLLAMDTDELSTNMLKNLREDARAKLVEAKIGQAGIGLTKDGVRLRIARPSDVPAAMAALNTLSEPLSNNFITGSNERNLTVEQQGTQNIRLALTEAGLKARITDGTGAGHRGYSPAQAAARQDRAPGLPCRAPDPGLLIDTTTKQRRLCLVSRR